MRAVVARCGRRAARSATPSPVRALETSTGAPSSARSPAACSRGSSTRSAFVSRMHAGTPPSRDERDEALQAAEVQVAVRGRDDEAEVDVRRQDLDARAVGPAQDAEAREHLADRAARLDADPVADDRRVALVQQRAGDRRLPASLGTAQGDTPAVDGDDSCGLQARGQVMGHALGPTEGEQLRVQRKFSWIDHMRGRRASRASRIGARGDLRGVARRVPRSLSRRRSGDVCRECARPTGCHTGATRASLVATRCTASTVEEMSGVRETAILAEGLKKSYGQVQALDGVDLAVAARHRVRAARPERRRQDHLRPDPHDAARARRRARGGRRARRRARRDAAARPHRARRAVRGGRREPHRGSRTSRWSGGSTT